MRKAVPFVLAAMGLVASWQIPARAGRPARPASQREAQEPGLPAQVVDFTPDSTGIRKYATTDYSDPAHVKQGRTRWRVVSGTGNAAELWLTVTRKGRLLDLGGRYVNYSDDRGATWKSVRPLEPLVNAEGSVVVAPNGDVLGVTWDPYSGDRVLTYKFSAAEGTWYYTYNPIHTPFWDRPGIDLVPGPFVTPLGTVPYIVFINGFPHDPWYYSTDGLNYTNVSSMSGDESLTSPLSGPLGIKANSSFDWIQPNTYFPFAALGAGRGLSSTSDLFSPTDMRWHRFTPTVGTVRPTMQVDSRGRLHSAAGNTYSMSSDGGRTWKTLTLPGGIAGDFRANAAAGVAAVWALDGQQDLVYKIDIRGSQPKLIRRYVVGQGDDCRCGSLGTYGLTGGHRFDFSSIVVFPDGRVGVSFMDSTTKMAFPTLDVEVVAPALAVELSTNLKP